MVRGRLADREDGLVHRDGLLLPIVDTASWAFGQVAVRTGLRAARIEVESELPDEPGPLGDPPLQRDDRLVGLPDRPVLGDEDVGVDVDLVAGS